jgi:hypothetical protein
MDMNRILTEIGLGCCAFVDGFIPPNAFMEFQAYNVLVIASDIRQLNILDTPAQILFMRVLGTVLPILNMPNIYAVW